MLCDCGRKNTLINNSYKKAKGWIFVPLLSFLDCLYWDLHHRIKYMCSEKPWMSHIYNEIIYVMFNEVNLPSAASSDHVYTKLTVLSGALDSVCTCVISIYVFMCVTWWITQRAVSQRGHAHRASEWAESRVFKTVLELNEFCSRSLCERVMMIRG